MAAKFRDRKPIGWVVDVDMKKKDEQRLHRIQNTFWTMRIMGNASIYKTKKTAKKAERYFLSVLPTYGLSAKTNICAVYA